MFMTGSGHADELHSMLRPRKSILQAEKREARANHVKLDAEQLERLLFQLFERKVSWLFDTCPACKLWCYA